MRFTFILIVCSAIDWTIRNHCICSAWWDVHIKMEKNNSNSDLALKRGPTISKHLIFLHFPSVCPFSHEETTWKIAKDHVKNVRETQPRVVHLDLRQVHVDLHAQSWSITSKCVGWFQRLMNYSQTMNGFLNDTRGQEKSKRWDTDMSETSYQLNASSLQDRMENENNNAIWKEKERNQAKRTTENNKCRKLNARTHYMQMQRERTVEESTGDEFFLWFQLYHHLQLRNKCIHRWNSIHGNW